MRPYRFGSREVIEVVQRSGERAADYQCAAAPSISTSATDR